jgi:hypothetical protein
MSKKDIEYDDAYVLEERHIFGGYDLTNVDFNENLSLDSLELTEENIDIEDFAKLKVASDISKKKIEDKKIKTTEFSPRVIKREEIVEDYIRNFLSKYILVKTLEEFNVSFI